MMAGEAAGTLDDAARTPDPDPPFPRGLSPRAATGQATALLGLFYAAVYGMPLLLGGVGHRILGPMLSSLFIGGVMLLAVAAFTRRDGAPRASLGLRSRSLARAAAWSLLGFVITYAANLVMTALYVSLHGGLEAVAARRAGWMAVLADLPVGAILPLALFVALWEETVFRGFLLGRLRAALPSMDEPTARRRRDRLAILLTAFCFGAGHGYQGLLGLIQTTTAGVVLGALTVRTGSLAPAVGTHLAIDVFGLFAVRLLRHLS
jgi:membrane protease YdiL (CAAX protease family)